MKRALTALGLLAVAASACATPKRYMGPDGADGAIDAEPDASRSADRPDPDTPAGPFDGPSGDSPTLIPDAPRDVSAATDVSPPGDAPCGSFSDPRNCGTCGHDCTKLANVIPGAPVMCQVGHCSIPASSCATGYGHCGSAPADNGCETNIAADDPLNCGSCGHSCLGGPCANGRCQPIQIYAGTDASFAYAVDANYVYFVREKSQLRLISRISKVDGSGLQDIWATDIGPFQAGLVLVNGMIYWAGSSDIMGCPAPNCAGGPQIQAPNQPQVYNLFADVSKTHLFWIATDISVPGQSTLMQLGVASPIATSMEGFSNGTADGSFVYLNEALGIVRIALNGGARTPIGRGFDPAINSSRIVFDLETPVPTDGSSPAITSVLQSAPGGARTTLGDYGTFYDIWGGIVLDEQDVYWMVFGAERGTMNEYTFIYRCPLTGCGSNPTILAQGTYPVGFLKTDGQALFTAGSNGIFKLAK